MLSECRCVSNVDTLSLEEYCCVCQYLCSISMQRTRTICSCSENDIEREVVYTFCCCFPHLDYETDSAKRSLVCMPLACIRIGEPSSVSQTYVMELTSDADYNMVRQILKRLQPLATRKELCRKEVPDFLSLAQTHREKECLRCALFRTSGLTPCGAHKILQV